MPTPADSISNLAFSAQGLDALRMKARQSPELAIKQAAQQFESVFMNMMMKSMREATPQDGMLDSEQTRTFTAMLDQQLAQNMASRGIGLADEMARQLGRTLKIQPSPDAAESGKSADAHLVHGPLRTTQAFESQGVLPVDAALQPGLAKFYGGK